MNECTLCDKESKYFSSPIGNPDEPRLCRKHFNEMNNNMKKALKKVRQKKLPEKNNEN